MELRGIKVLLIEDNLADAKLMQKMLSKCERVDMDSFHVFEDGQSALEYFHGKRRKDFPDIIFMDLNVPKINGLEILCHLKASEQFQRIPVIVLSSSVAEHDVRVAYDNFANAYLHKPVDLVEYRVLMHNLEQFWFNTCLLPGYKDEE